MRRDQLEHAIRTACQIIHQTEVIVVGSQAIVGTYDESQLPEAATMSIEVGILAIADSNDETARLTDLIEGVAGEFSPFEELHGFGIDGVDLETAVLPDGCRERLVKVQNANTSAPAGEPRFTGWCLDKEDLCVAKLITFREKDRNFVGALLEANLVDAGLIASRHPPAHSSTLPRSCSTRTGTHPTLGRPECHRLFFENLVVRDVRIYAQKLGGQVHHRRDQDQKRSTSSSPCPTVDGSPVPASSA